jgi:hypothetical protein
VSYTRAKPLNWQQQSTVATMQMQGMQCKECANQMRDHTASSRTQRRCKKHREDQEELIKLYGLPEAPSATEKGTSSLRRIVNKLDETDRVKQSLVHAIVTITAFFTEENTRETKKGAEHLARHASAASNIMDKDMQLWMRYDESARKMLKSQPTSNSVTKSSHACRRFWVWQQLSKSAPHMDKSCSFPHHHVTSTILKELLNHQLIDETQTTEFLFPSFELPKTPGFVLGWAMMLTDDVCITHWVNFCRTQRQIAHEEENDGLDADAEYQRVTNQSRSLSAQLTYLGNFMAYLTSAAWLGESHNHDIMKSRAQQFDKVCVRQLFIFHCGQMG